MWSVSRLEVRILTVTCVSQPPSHRETLDGKTEGDNSPSWILIMPRDVLTVFGDVGFGRGKSGSIPLGQVRPEPAPGERETILSIEGFVASIGTQRRPLLQVRVQQSGALAVLSVPGGIITGKGKGLAEMCLDRRKDGQSNHVVQEIVPHGTDDV